MHRFEILRYRPSETLVENRRCNLPRLYLALAPPLGVTTLEFRLEFRFLTSESRPTSLGYHYVDRLRDSTFSLLILCRRVTDGWTDGHTTTAYIPR